VQVSVAALALPLIVAGAVPAAAPPPEPITVVGAADQYEITVTDPGRPGARHNGDEGSAGAAARGTGRTSAAAPRCRYLPRRDDVVRWGHLEFDASDATRGTWWYILCDDGYADLRFVPDAAPPTASPAPPGAAVTPEELARQAVGLLALGRPEVRTAPPLGTPSLVNLPTLIWLPAASWAPRSRRVQAGEVWAQATARPRAMAIEGAGVGRVVCQGPGTPYEAGTLAEAADCAVTFRRPGRYRLTVTVEWGGAWIGSGGTGGALPALEARATSGVGAVEAHSVLVAGNAG
jgi:hypothetical protein